MGGEKLGKRLISASWGLKLAELGKKELDKRLLGLRLCLGLVWVVTGMNFYWAPKPMI